MKRLLCRVIAGRDKGMISLCLATAVYKDPITVPGMEKIYAMIFCKNGIIIYKTPVRGRSFVFLDDGEARTAFDFETLKGLCIAKPNFIQRLLSALVRIFK